MKIRSVISGLLPILVLFVGCSSGSVHKLDGKELAEAQYRIGNGALTEGDATGALRHYALAEKDLNDYAPLYHSKALAFYAKKDLKEALASAEKAIQLDPGFSAALNTYGKVLMDLGKPKEAETPLVKAASDPLFGDAYLAETNLGILYYREGKFSVAEKRFDNALNDGKGKSCVASYYKGHLYLRRKDFHHAARSYRQALQGACANFSEARFALGVAYEKDGLVKKAKKIYLEIQELHADSEIADKAMSRLRSLP